MDAQVVPAIELLDRFRWKRCAGGNADANGAEAVAITEGA